MIKRILIFFLLMQPGIAYCQDEVIEAVYYDNLDQPYKIEKKVIKENITIFIKHTNENSVLLKRELSISNDTTRITESFYNILTERTKLEKFYDCDLWSVSSSASDTVILVGYRHSLEDSLILIGDTTLTGDAARGSMDFGDRIKKMRVPSILSKELAVRIDSLRLWETHTIQLVNNIPVKFDVFDSLLNNRSSSHGILSIQKFVWKKYFAENLKQAAQIDSISWNTDSTEIIWLSHKHINPIRNSRDRYCINNNHLQIFFYNSIVQDILFVNDQNIFQNLLLGRLIYRDVFNFIELRLHERERVIRSSIEGQVDNNQFIYDYNNRVIEQISFQDSKLRRRVKYVYDMD